MANESKRMEKDRENFNFYVELRHYIENNTYHQLTINSEKAESRKRMIRRESKHYLMKGYVGTGKRGKIQAIYSEATHPGYCFHFCIQMQ